ncbi:ATP:guanido phosphotransferase, N-terminal [Pseudocohnilembus persalinus]|uniref:ATP:guanido phosphotransferase, N-terminal n=1 Tax=Pseudocohnilembus persalinus TaxID=266149 RepID=A0A0V0QX42_PSEPJ|nr:ATP:guanido phosphotransferase, N-terminal [Pseudocohnilembus persalinus]|eukprot:KRX06940.1 ATP:guanido phosphotransferase, N-terminal [Pseudocohnilembus persalinus]
MALNMNESLFNEYKNVKSSNGWTIARAINTGILYPESFVGCHAGDQESYHIFSKFFYPIIESYHTGFKVGQSQHKTNLNIEDLKINFSENASNRIISSRIRCARQITGFPLNPSGSLQSRKEILELMQKVVSQLPEEFQGQLIQHDKMTPEQEKQLIEDHFLFKGKDKMQAASGYHEHWPHGRGIFHNNKKTFMIWINEGDHLRVISMDGKDIKQVFNKFSQGLNLIENILKRELQNHQFKWNQIQYQQQEQQEQEQQQQDKNDQVEKESNKQQVQQNIIDSAFQFDDQLGTITCCPSNLGGGLRASVHIKLPRLAEKYGLHGLDEICRKMHCQARGSSGEHSSIVDRIDISNWRRLGFSEIELVSDIINCVNVLSQQELELEQLELQENQN